MTPEERRAENRRRHWEARQQRETARGPKGIAAAWWDQARMVAAAEEEKQGAEDAWHDLARFLKNYCARYSK